MFFWSDLSVSFYKFDLSYLSRLFYMNVFLFCGYKCSTCCDGVYFRYTHTSWHTAKVLLTLVGTLDPNVPFSISVCCLVFWNNRKQCYHWARMIRWWGGETKFWLWFHLGPLSCWLYWKTKPVGGKAEYPGAFLSINQGGWCTQTLVFLCIYPWPDSS